MFKVEVEQETDGRWTAEVPELPGAMVYGGTHDEAITRAQALALRILAERLERSGVRCSVALHGRRRSSPSPDGRGSG